MNRIITKSLGGTVKLFLRNYLLLILLSFLTLSSCTEDSTTDSNTPSVTPLSINYGISGDLYMALLNNAVELNQKVNFGSQVRFSISPSLTNGMFLNVNSGSIKGTPIIESLPTAYIITANVDGKSYRKAIFLGVARNPLWITPISSNHLAAYVAGDGAEQGGFTWGSSDPSLITVNDKGIISFNTGGNAGSSVIIYAKKGSYSNGISVSLNDYLGIGKSFTIGTYVHLVINNGIETIQPNQFENKGLTSVVIPDGVKIIGDNAFINNQLTSVVIPNSVRSIGIQAFWMNKLTSVVIPNSVTNIGNLAFWGNRLTSVVIPNSLRSIGGGVFFNNLLTNVVIPDSVEIISERAFLKNRLTSVLIPNSVKNIGSKAFAQNQLTSVVIPNSVTNIDDGAFENNPNLGEVSLKQSLYDKIISSINAIFGTKVTNYIKRL